MDFPTAPPDRTDPADPNRAPATFYADREHVFEVALHEPPSGSPSHIPEAFVQDVWERQSFVKSDLRTTRGEDVVVLRPGTRNTDAGPDFSEALLKIDGVEWAGDVEIHVQSVQWNEHRHHEDSRYNSVVLHVALHADVWTGTLQRRDGSTLPELVLYPRLTDSVRKLVHTYYSRDATPIVCASQWASVPESVVRSWIHELAERRLADRARRVRRQSQFGFDAAQHLYERTFVALGYAKNAQAMHDLARRLPLNFVLNKLEPEELEACYLGVAGLIPQPADLLKADRETADHAMALREQFDRLRLRHDLREMSRESWKFFRLRPANFPPVRIVQGVALLGIGGLLRDRPIERLRSACVSAQPLRALRQAFHIELPDFWTRHVRLEKPSAAVSAEIGRQRVDVILINAVLPVLARLSAQQNDAALERALLKVLETIPPEKDEVVRIFKQLGTMPRSARDAQGMHQLYGSFCRHARCLSCRIGQHLLAPVLPLE